jgi:signal transduction histidine kinase
LATGFAKDRSTARLARGAFSLHADADALAALCENVPECILVHRLDRVLFANRAFTELLGAGSIAEARAERVSTFLDPVAPRAESAEPGEAFGAVVRSLRGMTTAVEVRSWRVVYHGGEASLSIVRDLAAREQEARTRAQNERLASLGRLAANLGHEINNPLSYVVSNLGYLQSLLGGLEERLGAKGDAAPTPEELAAELVEARGAAGDALEGAERVAAIVRDVRALSRIEGRELSKVSVADVLQSALRIVKGKITEVAELGISLDAVPAVKANETALLQVFVNLLVNAADACAELPSEGHEVDVSCSTDSEGRAVVEIRDTGPGIPEDLRARLFEPFFTTKPTGNGFGLAISYAIVESFAGALTLSNHGLRGAVARVALPPAEKPRRHRGPTSERRRPVSVSAPRP